MSVSADPRIGSELLGYRIEALLGRGGMSVVYRAEDLRLKRKVALKLLAPELAEDERFRERFLRESELAASLDHPSIVPIYGAGEVDGQLYIAMRYVAGSDLKRLLKSEGPLEPKRALQLLAQLADALDAAHALGLVHRDVKPSNALLDSAEHLYLADFGLTKSASDRSALTLTGRIIGTVDYAAPEQIEGKSVDGRTDVYSLGCLLYECLTGQVPFPRDSELAVLWAHVHEKPPEIAAHPALDSLVGKALAKDPEKRYASCHELVEAARDALGLRELVVVRDRRPLLIAGLGALVAVGALAAGLVLALGGSGKPKPDLTVRKNTLVRIDPTSNKISAVIRVGGGPESVAVGGNTVWVYNWADGTVSKVDARTDTVRGTIGITGSQPSVPAQTIAADASGAWVVSAAAKGGLLTHLRPALLPQRISLPYDAITLAVGQHAVWVGAKTTQGSALLKLDPLRGTVLETVQLGSSDVQSVAVGGGAVWALALDGTLFRIDPASSRITRRRRLPTRGSGVAAVAVGYGAAWALLDNSAALLRIDPQTLEATKTIPPPVSPSGAAIGGGVPNLVLGDSAVWWNGTDTGAVWRVDPSSGSIVSTIHVATPIADQKGAPLSLFEPLGMATGAGSVWATMSLPF